MLSIESEERKGYVVSAKMKKVWQVQLTLVEKLLEVCEKHHLKIWADGGTLLGTVRESGFIPWDDDIDMAMLRPDYDKLVEISAKEFTSPFFFQCGYSEKVYPFGHSQLRMDGTTAILNGTNLLPLKIHQGIFIDIFPYDAEPDDVCEYEKLVVLRGRTAALMDRVAEFDFYHPYRSINHLRFKKDFPKLYKSYEDLFRKYSIDNNNRVSCLSFILDKEKLSRDKHWYDDTLLMPFENIEMPVPIGYDSILRKQYGDYMTPIKAPSYHGGFWVLDPDQSYHSYLFKYKLRIIFDRLNGLWARIRQKLKL